MRLNTFEMNKVSGKNSIAIGKNITIAHDNCIIIGNDLNSTENNCLCIGSSEVSISRVMTDEEHKELYDMLIKVINRT